MKFPVRTLSYLLRQAASKKEAPTSGEKLGLDAAYGDSISSKRRKRGLRVLALIRRHDLRHHIRDSFRARFIPTSFYSVASKTRRIARVMPHVYFRVRVKR
jgi:hypothetical protein